MLRPLLFLTVILINAVILNAQKRSLRQGTGTSLPEDFQLPDFTCDFQGQFPYTVSVRSAKGEHICGGVVISDDAILTAAHCVDFRTTNDATVSPMVHVGGFLVDKPVQIRETQRAFPHPDWKGITTDGNDLVILKLSNKTCSEPIHTLGVEGAQDKENFLLLGFGRSAEGGSFAGLLQGSIMNTLKTKQCNKRYDLTPKLRDTELCARGATTVGLCNGDDGSPIIFQPTLRFNRDVLVGIASYSSAECTETEGVAIFMDINKYSKWIKKTLKSKKYKQA